MRTRAPVTLDGSTIICSVRNCGAQWTCDDTGKTAFLCHVVGDHKFPALSHGDGSIVREITAVRERKLGRLLPFIPQTVGAMGDMEMRHPDPKFGGFYDIYNYDLLSLKTDRCCERSPHN